VRETVQTVLTIKKTLPGHFGGGFNRTSGRRDFLTGGEFFRTRDFLKGEEGRKGGSRNIRIEKKKIRRLRSEGGEKMQKAHAQKSSEVNCKKLR